MVVFYHHKLTLARMTDIRQCLHDQILNINKKTTSAHVVFDYFSRIASEQESLEVYPAHSFRDVNRLMQLFPSYNALHLLVFGEQVYVHAKF